MTSIMTSARIITDKVVSETVEISQDPYERMGFVGAQELVGNVEK